MKRLRPEEEVASCSWLQKWLKADLGWSPDHVGRSPPVLAPQRFHLQNGDDRGVQLADTEHLMCASPVWKMISCSGLPSSPSPTCPFHRCGNWCSREVKPLAWGLGSRQWQHQDSAPGFSSPSAHPSFCCASWEALSPFSSSSDIHCGYFICSQMTTEETWGKRKSFYHFLDLLIWCFQMQARLSWEPLPAWIVLSLGAKISWASPSRSQANLLPHWGWRWGAWGRGCVSFTAVSPVPSTGNHQSWFSGSAW